MLDEAEWEVISPLLDSFIAQVKDYRQVHRVSLRQAREQIEAAALDEFARLTGTQETNVDAIWHHRLSLYGPPCRSCGRPLRTPAAKLCGSCMTAREEL